jgi:hypothetical protein
MVHILFEYFLHYFIFYQTRQDGDSVFVKFDDLH